MRLAPVLAAAALPGARVKRLEDPRLLAGRGRYLDDVTLPGLLHAAFVRSPHAHARRAPRSTPRPRARCPGWRCVLTGRDLDGAVAPAGAAARGGRLHADRVARARRPARVRFVGEAVAVVAADTPYVAADGAELVHVEYEPLPAVPDVAAALDPRRAAPAPEPARNVLFERRGGHGDVDGAFARGGAS